MSKEIQKRLLRKLLVPINEENLNVPGYNLVRADRQSITKC